MTSSLYVLKSGSEGKDQRAFGHKSLVENRLKKVFVYRRILGSTLRTENSSGISLFSFSN